MSSRLGDYLTLTKPGITRLVLVTTGAGFYLASRGGVDLALLAHTLLGTAFVAGGTNALNQYWERDADALMQRTRNRPLPAGRLQPARALAFATTIAALGLLYLTLLVNLTTAAIEAVSLVSYIFVYTPLKRRTSLSTILGAVPGALPVVAGWTAAGGRLGLEAWILFTILFLWQLPHFLALAWMFRDDYQAGGFRMLTLLDPEGLRTGRQILVYAVALLPVSLLPTLIGLTGGLYFAGALLVGAGFIAFGAAVLLERTDRRARRLFLASVAYLPMLFVLMLVDKVPQ